MTIYKVVYETVGGGVGWSGSTEVYLYFTGVTTTTTTTTTIAPDLSGAYLVWELDAQGGGTTQDSTTNNNDGTLETSFSTSSFEPPTNLDGYLIPTTGDDGIQAPEDTTNVTSLSVSNWWYGNPSNGTGGESLIWGTSAMEARLIAVEKTASTYELLYEDFTNGSYIVSVGTFTDYNWLHTVLVRDNSSVKLYANNTLILNTTPTLGTLSNRLFSLNDYTSYTPNGSQCRLSQTAIWHKKLNSSDVSYLNNSNNGRKYINW